MRFTKEQYEAAIEALRLGMEQLKPDGACCTICGDSGHQAWECGHTARVVLPERDDSALVAAAKRVCASLRADSAPAGTPIAELRDEIARRS